MAKKIGKIHKKWKNKNPAPELQEDLIEDTENPETEDLTEEFEVEPIEIPDVFPEELSEDMETDIPDAPEPKPQKKGIFSKILGFLRNILLEEEENDYEDFKDSENSEDPEELEESEKPEVEYFEEEQEESVPELSEELSEILPENVQEEQELPPEIDQDRLFPDLDESEFAEIVPEEQLPDPEFLDDIADLPNPADFDELDALEQLDLPEESDEFIDAPETMPDGFVSDPEHMVFIPDEIAFSEEVSDAEIQPETEPETESRADPEPDAKKPKSHILGKLVAVLATAACITGVVIAFRNGMFDEKEIYYMPDLTGENYLTFQNDLQLDFQIDQSEYSAYEKDRIYHQDIPVGEEIKPGQTVHIAVSLGLATEIIPDVRNYQLAYAQKTLEQAGFKTEIQYEMSQGGTEPGNVIRTEPAIGQEITIDQTVILYISQGSDNQVATVPDVLGKSLEEARILCEEAGLSVEAVAVPSLEPENVVVTQSLEANIQTNFDTIIVLSYSNSEQPAGTINYQLELPAYANGRFILDFIDEEGTVIATSTFVAGFSAGSDIPVTGYGAHEIRVVLNNGATTKQETIGVYHFDFTTGSYQIISEDVQAAFEAVDGIG
ncbi:MAG: PASTA domain-containing protein [Oscillospiraceae bacterium]|nr:PASTA domain-containing protein [Oscillospiraceae bacterium]